jgi:hypothetical protein
VEITKSLKTLKRMRAGPVWTKRAVESGNGSHIAMTLMTLLQKQK